MLENNEQIVALDEALVQAIGQLTPDDAFWLWTYFGGGASTRCLFREATTFQTLGEFDRHMESLLNNLVSVVFSQQLHVDKNFNFASASEFIVRRLIWLLAQAGESGAGYNVYQKLIQWEATPVEETRTLLQKRFGDQFIDDREAYRFFLEALHPNGLHCPDGHSLQEHQLPHKIARTTGIPSYRCKECSHVFNLFSGFWSGRMEIRPSQFLEILRGISQTTSYSDISRITGIHRSNLPHITHKCYQFWRDHLAHHFVSEKNETKI